MKVDRQLSPPPLRSRRTNISSQSQTPLGLHAFPGADDQKAGGSTTSSPCGPALRLRPHHASAHHSLYSASTASSRVSCTVHRIIKRARARSGAYRLVARHGCWMEEAPGRQAAIQPASLAIRAAGQAWMDAMNNGSLQCRLGERIGDGSFAGRPAGRWQLLLRPKGGGKKGWCRLLGTYHCIPAAASCCRRDERLNTTPGVEKRSMILGAGTGYVRTAMAVSTSTLRYLFL